MRLVAEATRIVARSKPTLFSLRQIPSRHSAQSMAPANESAVMETTLMKRLAMIGTTVFLLLGTSAAYATQDKPEGEKPAKQEGKPEAKPEARPAAKPAAKPEAKPR